MFKSKREKELEDRLAELSAWHQNLKNNLEMRDRILGRCQEFIELIKNNIDYPFEGFEGIGFKHHFFSDRELDAENRVRALEQDIERLRKENKYLREKLEDKHA